MADDETTFEGWAVLELMGHRRLAGYVTEVELAGKGMLRLDVPGPDDEPTATQFYSPAALYCLTPVTEDVAHGLAARNQPEPVHRWELPERVAAGAQSPRITDRHGEEFDSYDEAARAIAGLLGDGGRTWFRYDHYSAFDVHISHHAARIYALSVAYRGREPQTVIWRPDVDGAGVAAALKLNDGHDQETVAQLLADIGGAMQRGWRKGTAAS